MTVTQSDTNDDVLAYLRGELRGARLQSFETRLRIDSELQDELRWMQALAEIETQRYADETAERAFAALQDRLGPAPLPQPRSPWVRLTTWLSRCGRILQPALLTLIVVQAGVIGVMFEQRTAIITEPVSADVADSIVRGSTVSCLGVWIDINAGAAFDDVMHWLVAYGGALSNGPDASGRILVVFRDSPSLKAALGDADLKRFAHTVENPQGCTHRD